MPPGSVRYHVAFVVVILAALGSPASAIAASPVDRLRYFPAPDREQAMVGGKITGSNVSDREGFEPIAEIKTAPTGGHWNEIVFSNTKLYRWIRYEAPPGSHGNVAELEFYSGQKLLLGRTFGSFGWRQNRNWPRAFDKQTDTWFDSSEADGQYLGIDVGEAATAQMPRFDPLPTEGPAPASVDVTLRCNTPGATVRYAFDGAPGAGEGTLYESPIHLDRTATIFATAFKEGMPPSPVAAGTFVVGSPLKEGLHTFHVGNSLTASTLRFPDFARAAGFKHDYHPWVKNGGNTPMIWQHIITTGRMDWERELGAIAGLDHFTLQPRLAAYTDADLTSEAQSEVLLFAQARIRFPQVEKWIYAEWPRRWEGEQTTAWPGRSANYEEACSTMLAYVETIQHKVWPIDGGKHAHLLPCVLGVGWLRHRIDAGEIPGLSAKDFDPVMYYDNVHPGDPGRYFLCLMWYSAFYGESPVGRIPPVGMNISASQAAAYQRLAWDVVSNYPDCGLYQEGPQACSKPEIVQDGPLIHLQSDTAGAWFRYTLDGSVPTRTRGFVYCGAITARPGILVKALAYKSGMADSEIESQ